MRNIFLSCCNAWAGVCEAAASWTCMADVWLVMTWVAEFRQHSEEYLIDGNRNKVSVTKLCTRMGVLWCG